MSIESYVNAAKLLYDKGFFEEALCLTSITIDAVSKETYPKKNVGERYKKFLRDHFREICNRGFPGIDADGIKIKVCHPVENLKTDECGDVDIPEILYHIIRCGLAHDCKMHSGLIFTHETEIGDWTKEGFKIPKAVLLGLLDIVESHKN